MLLTNAVRGSLVSSVVRKVGVGSGPLVGHLSHVPSVGVSIVLDVLDPAVRESDRV